MNALKKLKSRAGESLGEVLISVLNAALAMALLAGMIASTVNLVKKSKDAFTNGGYVTAENALASRSGTPGGSGTMTFTYGSGVGDKTSYSVGYYTQTIGGKTVVSYR